MIRAFFILFSAFIWYSSENFKKKIKKPKVPVFPDFLNLLRFFRVFSKKSRKIGKVYFLILFLKNLFLFTLKIENTMKKPYSNRFLWRFEHFGIFADASKKCDVIKSIDVIISFIG